MSFNQVVEELRSDDQFMTDVTAWRIIAAKSAVYAPFLQELNLNLKNILVKRSIRQLYSHQAEAIEQALDGRHVAVVTPTASGKTLCYNLPVLNTLCDLHGQNGRALYLFPTKALAQDQFAELVRWQAEITQLEPASSIQVATYDGDTPRSRRASIRRTAQIILTNPDMLHVGILPYHANWANFFAGLRWIVLDEMHVYRGIFGSQVANVLRRLQRICAFYGSAPQFICTSATIANPGQLAQRLIEQPVTLIRKNGAPGTAKHIILYNPPCYDPEQGIRRSSTLVTQELAARCVLGDVQTLAFGRSRLTTEILLTYLRQRVSKLPPTPLQPTTNNQQPTTNYQPPATNNQLSIRGYRAGYLPAERRAIEAGLRSGEIKAVVATNALELGIDIGQLQAVILCGYPGSIASTWQQIGRAGRRMEHDSDEMDDGALAILVATGGVLDQYIIQHPEFIFERSPERAIINPDNLALLVDQVRCALFELPFQPGEQLGKSPHTEDVLALLAEEGIAHVSQGRSYWADEGYPAQQVNLRSASNRTIVIQSYSSDDVTFGPGDEVDFMGSENVATVTPITIGQIDLESAIRFLHKGAIYLHEGESYLIETLDLENDLALVRPTNVDYYTEVTTDTDLEVEEIHDQREDGGATVAHGDIMISDQVIGFRRVQHFTHENVGVVPLDYPPSILATSAYWFDIAPAVQEVLEEQGLWYDSPNNYGPNWQKARSAVRARDHYLCTQCGRREQPDHEHDVHHLVPFRTFGYVPRLNENYLAANELDNLVLVCRPCHRRMESLVRVRTGLDGLAYVLHHLSPLYLMCDRQDIDVYVVRQDGKDKSPGTLYIYERVVAGLGFSKHLFDLHQTLLAAAHEVIQNCACRNGCPACVGPVLDGIDNPTVQLPTKRLTLGLVAELQS